MKSGGSDAVTQVRQRDFVVAICDVRLSDGDGIQLLKRMQQLNPDLFVLIITAYATVESTVEAFKAGAYDYLVKPVLVDDPTIPVPEHFTVKSCPGCVDGKPTAEGRGGQKDVWALEQSIDRGYAVATCCCADIDPDRNDFTDGHALTRHAGLFHSRRPTCNDPRGLAGLPRLCRQESSQVGPLRNAESEMSNVEEEFNDEIMTKAE